MRDISQALRNSLLNHEAVESDGDSESASEEEPADLLEEYLSTLGGARANRIQQVNGVGIYENAEEVLEDLPISH